jgi:hypothetical protein
VAGAPNVIWTSPVASGESFKGGNTGGEGHPEVELSDKVHQWQQEQFGGSEVRVSGFFPQGMVTVEIAAQDNMCVIWDVIVWEPGG